MASPRSVEDRVRMVFLFAEYKSYALVVRNWGMENPPDRDTVSSTIRRFQSTGNANPPKKPGRSPSVLDDGGMEMVSCSLEEEPELF